MDKTWAKIGDAQFKLRENPNDWLANGYRAFAYCQAAMYAKLAKVSLENWSVARSRVDELRK